MICKRGKSFLDKLSSRSKRLFILLLAFSAILTYVLYGNTSRNNRTLKLSHLTNLKNLDKKPTVPSDVKSRTTSRPAREITNLEHVESIASSDFKTTLNPIHTSSRGQKIPSKFFEEETKSITPEDVGRRGQRGPHIDEYSSEGVDNNKGNYSVSSASKQGDRKQLLNFDSQVEDDRDSDVSDFDLEEGENRKRLPNAIIIGVKKGGTRALLEILKIHPSIRASSSEVHFFDRDENYEQGLEWYRQQMPTSLPGQITIEKSPSYFITPKVPERVYRMSKSVKLIAIVRDPTRRAISDYTQSLGRKPDNPPFEEIKDNGEVDEDWSKIAFGRYAEHLALWLKYFPVSQIHFVSGEELIKKPAKEIKLVELFLNLKPFITENNFYFNESKGFPCFVGKISNSGSVSRAHCMGETKGRKHPAVHKEVLKRLHEYFHPLNEKFYSMVQRNFHW